MPTPADQRPFRFFDNREKYLLFVNTCSEKQETAARIGSEIEHLRPRPPALRVFEAGSGEGSILSMVLRELHHRWPTVPLLVVVKEISRDFLRIALAKLADRFYEHPSMVLVLTNMFYTEAPRLFPNRRRMQDRLKWREVALAGDSAHEFNAQIGAELAFVEEAWRTTPSPVTGNPLYDAPSVLVLYRADHAFALHDVIPERGRTDHAYDLVIASQPYRCRLPAEKKVNGLLAPLASTLAPGGRMIATQSTGRDPGMEIVRAVWPDHDPFPTPRGVLIDALRARLEREERDLVYPDPAAKDAEFRYRLQLDPNELDTTIGTSTLLAAWNAATYVAQIEDRRLTHAMSRSGYLEATRDVLREHDGLWFTNESIVIARPGASEQADEG